jgi:hypothetical protein
MSYPGLGDRLAAIRRQIEARQQLRGWTHPVTIVAVTKTHGPEAVLAALDAGLTDVGENRVQEALSKQAQVADLRVRWHLIGSLQSNKARQAVGKFALIHSVDRFELASELARRAAPGTRQAILLQVNCSGEAQKGGVDPDALGELLERVTGLEALQVRGLMTMAELTDDETRQRASFSRLRELQQQLQGKGYALPELSMGMSGDFGVAVEEGATMVRLGTLLFGERGT